MTRPLFGSPTWVPSLDFDALPSMYGLLNQPTVELLFTQQVFRQAGKNYALANYPGWTFTRASTKTALNSSGAVVSFGSGVPAITDLGFLGEAADTNLFTWSQAFTNAAWAPNGSVVTDNAVVAPDGTTTGAFLHENSATSQHFISRSANVAVTTGNTYAFSFIAKAGARSKIVLALAGSDLKDRTFDLSNGTTSTGQVIGTNPTSWAMTPLIGGWYLCSVTFVAASTTADARIYLSNGTTANYAGDGASGINLWAGQFSSLPGPYIPTTSAIVTRAADVASITYSGSPTTATVTYGSGSTATPSATSPLNLGSSSGGAWVGNYVQRAVVK